MKRLAEFVTRFPKTIIAVTMLITLVFGYFAKDLKIDINVYEYLPEGDPAIKLSAELDEKFGGLNILLVMLEVEKDIFNYPTLFRINRITERIEEDEDVIRVLSLSNITGVKSIEEGIEVSYLMAEIPEDKEELLNLRRKILGDPLYRGTVISEDGRFACIVAYLDASANYERLLENVREILAEVEGPGKLYLGGMPLINDTIARITNRDIERNTPLTIVIILLILWYTFRHLRGLLPLFAVGVALVWTFGLMAITGKSLTSMGAAIPPLLMAIGCAYVIHLVSRFSEEVPKTGWSKTTIVETMKGVGIPIVMAGVTTMVGFLSLLVSRLTIIRDFGIFVSFGVGCALLVSLTSAPAILFWRPARKLEKLFERRKEGKNIILQFFERITFLVFHHARGTLIFTGIIIVLALLGLPRLSTESNLIKYFKKDSPIRLAEEITRKNFGGSTLLEIFVEGDLKDPEVLARMEQIQQYLKHQPGVKNPISIVDLLKRMNFVLNDSNPEYDCLPESREAAAQYLLLYSMGEAGEFISTLINDEATEGLITARVASVSSQDNRALLRKIEKYLKEDMRGDKIKALVAGAPAVFEAVDRQIKQSQLTSMGFALLVVFILLTIQFRTLIAGLICMIPIVLTILFTFAVMSWTGIPLDIATSIIASMAIGIGIDYAIHFVSRYKTEFAQSGEWKESVGRTLSTTGKAILYNAVVVEAGFLVICLSELAINRNFGGLNVLTMVFSSLAAISVLPAILLIIKPEFITKGRLQVLLEMLKERREDVLLGELKTIVNELGTERLKTKLELAAITDGLTGLYSQRFFQESLEREIQRANRYKRKLSVIMLAIDHFKNYTDTYGHAKGDILLKQIAEILKKNLRQIDIAACYGAEELIVILPETDKEGAIIAAEKIRKVIEAYSFPDGVKITASFGVDTYPEVLDSADLIHQAEKGLYKAKATGGNRVC